MSVVDEVCTCYGGRLSKEHAIPVKTNQLTVQLLAQIVRPERVQLRDIQWYDSNRCRNYDDSSCELHSLQRYAG